MRRTPLLAPALVLGLALSACAQWPTAAPPLHTLLDFGAFDGREAELAAQGVRSGGSGRFSLDAEPEFIAVTPDSKTAFVALQESNAVAVIDIPGRRVVAVRGLGHKDHRLPGNALDPSDRDGGIRIANWPVYGAYMPDSVAAYRVNGQDYLITANEGDAREYRGFVDEARVSALRLDPAVFPNAAELQRPENLGRLTVSTRPEDTRPNAQGEATRLVAFGARSVSIWSRDLRQIGDTGDLFERVTAERTPASFNSNGTAETFDTRSDNKGPEPEALAVGEVAGRHFAFVGMERTGGIFVLDVSDPARPRMTDYAHHIDAQAPAASGRAGDLAPEGLLFIPAAQAPGGQPLLVSSNEASGSVSLYRVSAQGTLNRVGRWQAEPFAFGLSVAEISAYDPQSGRLFSVNGQSGGLDILDINDPTRPRLVGSVSLARHGKAANSVAVSRGVVAVAVEAERRTDPGTVVFLNAQGEPVAQPVTVGALPDMLTFTPDGTTLLVANEGEPNDDYSVDPPGTVSIIDVRQALARR